MSSTATLTIVKPGRKANALVAALGKVVAVDRLSDITFSLTLAHTQPESVKGVLGTVLTTAGFPDWSAYVKLEINELPGWMRIVARLDST